MLVNTIRGGERRDVLERVSRTLGAIAPIIVSVLSLGSLVGVTVLGFMAGRATAGGLVPTPTVLFVVRVVLGIFVMVGVLISTFAPMQTMMSSYTRLLLLPIPRSTLHLVEVLADLSDPWVAIALPGLAMFAV